MWLKKNASDRQPSAGRREQEGGEDLAPRAIWNDKMVTTKGSLVVAVAVVVVVHSVSKTPDLKLLESAMDVEEER